MIAPESAGYGFVPLANEVRRVVRPHAVLHRRTAGTWSGEIEVELTAEQPVHVGAGAKSVEGGAIVRKAALIQGKPGIPGSTLKGVLRSRFEAVTKSCIPHRPTISAKVLSRSHPDIRRARLTGHLLSEVEGHFGTGCRPGAPMCVACAMFGCMGVRGRVAVCDFATTGAVAYAIEEMPSQFAPRLHHVGNAHPAADRNGEKIFEVTSLHGRKFGSGMGPVVPKAGFQRVETIPRGAKVRGVLRVWCLADEELGGLLAALGRFPESTMKVGAGKGYGFGRMRISDLSCRLQRHGTGSTVDESAWRKAFLSSQDRFAKGEEALVELHTGVA